MFKEKLLKVKEDMKNKENGNNKKTIENLVVFVIILIITVVAINYVWKDNKSNSKTDNDVSSKTKTLASDEVEETSKNDDNLETNLENILAQIKGVGKVKVLVTYSKSSEVVPMYSEDSSQKTTEETDNGGGKRTINENTTKKDLAYQESNGVKTIITQSTVNPTIEGAVITAQGATNADIKASIVQAVEAATGLATYKIQVFEMQ